MAIEIITGKGKATETVTFGKSTLQFSSTLVDKLKLDEYKFVIVGIDEEQKKIFFKFQSQSTPDSMSFYSQGGRGSRKMIAAGELYKRDWIEKVRDEEDLSKKRFELKKLEKAEQGFKYYVQL